MTIYRYDLTIPVRVVSALHSGGVDEVPERPITDEADEFAVDECDDCIQGLFNEGKACRRCPLCFLALCCGLCILVLWGVWGRFMGLGTDSDLESRVHR